MNYPYNNNFNNPYNRTFNGPNYPMTQPQMVQVPMTSVQQPSQPMEMPFSYIAYGNLKETEGHILFPNQRALFIDRSNGTIYEKVCGSDGQSFILQYKKTDLNPVVNENKSEFVTKADLKDFVTVEQYEKTLQVLKNLKEQINNVSVKEPVHDTNTNE